MRIQHNIMAMNAYRNYNTNTSALSKNLEKLSSGYKINRAGDDAAGLAISEKMRAQITGLNAAQKNVKDGISLVKTAEGAMQEIQDMLNRMDYLATQSANGTYDNEVDRANLQKEVNSLKEEIDRIADSSNFNGIKLLDGSLAKEQTATKIEVGGNARTYKSAGSKAAYEADTVYSAAALGLKTDDTFEYTVSLENGKSYTAKFTVADDATGETTRLIAEDGTEYAITKGAAKGTSAATVAEIDKAIVAELGKTDLGNDFAITANAGKIKLEGKEVGTGAPAVKAMDAEWTIGGARATEPKIGVAVTAGVDEGVEIKADDLVEYNGKNYEDAVFTINGHKFVILANDQDPNTADADPSKNWLRAVEGLGKDVTVLVGGLGGLKDGGATDAPAAGGAADAANSNFTQNIKKIAEVTGLNVTGSIDEATATGAGANEGIRLSLSNKQVEGKGLQLQIGDTADTYNQMRVYVGDMHTKALGIKDLDISNPESASAAIETIRNAINSVSSVRGDLGAYQNRLEHTANNLSVMAENIQDAESTIRDTDVAEEMMAYTKNNILIQSAQAMLAQANAVPQGVLQLLG